MADLLFWVYLLNIIFLVNHEIDSAYWKEWDLFNLKGGITLFLIFHFPVLFLAFYGLIPVYLGEITGLLFSVVAGVTGVGAFCIHMFFIKIKGRKEFTTTISLFILTGTLILSIIQLFLTITTLYSMQQLSFF